MRPVCIFLQTAVNKKGLKLAADLVKLMNEYLFLFVSCVHK